MIKHIAVMVLMAQVGSANKWAPKDEFKDAIKHHLDECHPQNSGLVTTLTSGTSSYITVSGSGALIFPDSESQKLRRKADALELCEKPEDRLRKLIQ